MKEKKDKKKFRDTRVGKFLKDKAPKAIGSIIEVVGDVTGKEVLENIGKKIQGIEELTPEDKEHALKLLDLDLAEMDNITDRWVSDMSADSWLSKNVRPIILLSSWAILILIVIAGWLEIVLNESYISMFEVLAITVNAAYFGGRTFEKYTSIKR